MQRHKNSFCDAVPVAEPLDHKYLAAASVLFPLVDWINDYNSADSQVVMTLFAVSALVKLAAMWSALAVRPLSAGVPHWHLLSPYSFNSMPVPLGLFLF